MPDPSGPDPSGSETQSTDRYGNKTKRKKMNTDPNGAKLRPFWEIAMKDTSLKI
jgi:hypothetical protein